MALMNSAAQGGLEDVERALDPRVKGAELVALAAHREVAVRAAIAGRRDAPMASLISLAHERDSRILEALAANPSSPLWVLRKLSTDRRGGIRDAALARLREIER